MALALLVLRTAIALLSGALGWVLGIWMAPAYAPLLPAVAAGFLAGATSGSLNPAIAMQQALTVGLILTVLAFFLNRGAPSSGLFWLDLWPLWIIPASFSGASCLILMMRWRSKGQ